MTKRLTSAAILGAGLGSRLQSRAKAKPLSPILGETLLAKLVKSLEPYPFQDLSCALREELLSSSDKATLPALDRIRYLFVNTESSLHTLGVLNSALPQRPEHLFATMADTVLYPSELLDFLRFCEQLKENESAVLVTPFLDDEKPLYAHVNELGLVYKFSGDMPLEGPILVTSGMYCLSSAALQRLPDALESGMHKMRNFLSFLIEDGETIKTFVVQKSIDVDHPSDLDQAEAFLKGL